MDLGVEHHTPVGAIASIVLGAILGYVAVVIGLILGAVAAGLTGAAFGSVGLAFLVLGLVVALTAWGLCTIPEMIFGKKGKFAALVAMFVVVIIFFALLVANLSGLNKNGTTVIEFKLTANPPSSTKSLASQ